MLLSVYNQNSIWTKCVYAYVYIFFLFIDTLKHHTKQLEKRDFRKIRQRNVFKKIVKAFCPVDSAYINSTGLIYCQLLWTIVLFVPRCVVLHYACINSQQHRGNTAVHFKTAVSAKLCQSHYWQHGTLMNNLFNI